MAAPVRLDPPLPVQEIAARLEGAGYETWCVGGAVRDALLGRPHLDWDLATAAPPSEVRRLFRRTVPVGLEFGTVAVLDATGRAHEVTTFRHDVRTDGRHAVVEFGASLDEDLARRDFTINAMAWSTREGRLHDPFGGRADLQRRLVRAVGDPARRMAEDRLRALRALRFAGRFGFAIDPATWQAIADSAPALHRLSRERVQQELVKTLEQVPRPSESFALWERSGAFRELLPSLAGRAPWRYAAPDTRALPEASANAGIARRRTLVRLAALFVEFSRREAEALLSGLRFSNRDAHRTGHLVEVAGLIEGALSAGGSADDLTLRMWASRAGRTDTADAFRVAIAVSTARGAIDRERLRGLGRVYRRALRSAFRDAIEVADLAVDGEDLVRRAGVPPGPRVGETLRALLRHVLTVPGDNHAEALLAVARREQDRG